jgi:hypothetical protein
MKLYHLLAIFVTLALSAQADVYLYNTTNERMTWEVTLPNGDTKEGVVEEYRGYYPVQTTIPGQSDKITVFRLRSESGKSAVEVKGTYSQVIVLAIKDGGMRVLPLGWTLNSDQNHKREMTLLNATGQPQIFDIIDEKEVRKGLTLAAGQHATYPTLNPLGGSKGGFLTIRFADGQRVESVMSDGGVGVMYLDSREPGKVMIKNLGYITPPRQAVVK